MKIGELRVRTMRDIILTQGFFDCGCEISPESPEHFITCAEHNLMNINEEAAFKARVEEMRRSRMLRESQ